MTADDLDGHVWIASFIFTSCPDVCPALTAAMGRLERLVPGGNDPVRRVSISVDPQRDTPAVLAAWADRAGAGPNWLFLTGSRAEITALLHDGFRVASTTAGPADQPITHSDRFVLVDRARRIRGYYHGNDPLDLDRLARDATALHAGRIH